MESCVDILKVIINERLAFHVTVARVEWSIQDDGKVKEQLERLHANTEAIIEWV